MYIRFPLSLRQVEDLLHGRGIDICHETVRAWWNRFGPMSAADIDEKRSASMRTHIQWRWHLDEVFVRINGNIYVLWRAVDHEGEVLEVFVTKRRDRRAALRFLCKAMKRYGRPEVIVTDRLRSYHAAMKVIGNAERQETGRWLNNRAENSHQPLPRDESERWRSSGVQSRFRNSPRSTPQFTISSTRNVIFTTAKTSSSIERPPWQSGVNLRPEIYRLWGCADRFAFP